MRKTKILFLVTEDWYFWSHRLPLARAARDAGWEVLVATHIDRHGGLIEKAGFRLLPVSFDRGGRNPLRELRTIVDIVRLYAAETPDLVHHVASKPVIYGSLAARLCGVPAVVNAFAGLGFVFIARGWKAAVLRALVKLAYKLALSGSRTRTIFQNQDDLSAFVRAGLVPGRGAVLIKSSGVDTSAFAPSPEPEGEPLVALAGRMLWDKGVGEFVEAAKLLRGSGVKARFALVGDTDPHNPAAVPAARLERWRSEGPVEWWGSRDDMPRVLAQSHLACLPSYREGLPKFLIEAAASGRAIVATDVPGCREIVREGENGLLVPARDAGALVEALRTLIEDASLRRRMGARGREIAEQEYSVEKVVRETLSVYEGLGVRHV